MVTVTMVTENRQEGTSQSGDFSLTRAASQIPELARDERALSKESLAPCASVWVTSDCEIHWFAYSYSNGA